ncbi:zinc-dependent alcohol dehydrogenase [Microlunatus ginsengisoli]|uniref:Zinc-binding alcohol dehydrogenase n=1 Tax=Microlunatus ginsengisoli TaxID=363863 RepID=A0ABP7AJZ3_9ACTN
METTWTAYWTVGPGRGELRTEPARAAGPGEVTVRTLVSGISRGTELLVHANAVPAEVADVMRAPFQVGNFPAPVKYGYLSVGVVEAGPDELRGRRVFCLHPHQDRYVVPVSAVTPVPDDVPTERAVLAGTVETAINALWDGAPRIGDKIAVIGAGMIGGALARVLSSFPLDRLQLVDVNPARATLAADSVIDFVPPDRALGDCDLVFHCSASESGLATGLSLLGFEGELIELSWFGERAPAAPLGGAFHARRLTVRASQVGAVAPARRARRSTADRLALALGQLRDPAYDRFLTGASDFAELPATMVALSDDRDALCQLIRYPEGV